MHLQVDSDDANACLLESSLGAYIIKYIFSSYGAFIFQNTYLYD